MPGQGATTGGCIPGTVVGNDVFYSAALQPRVAGLK